MPEPGLQETSREDRVGQHRAVDSSQPGGHV